MAAGETVSLLTSSRTRDTILVLLAPDGTPVLGSDDYRDTLPDLGGSRPAAGTD
jgi:hypothetical protein